MPVIATNTSANTALIYLNKNSRDQSQSLAKLSSGSRIVRASDDAAGLAVSSGITSDITALKQAATNSIQAQSVLQTADGALARVGDILQRMKSLAAQSNSGSVSATARGYINTEFQQLLTEVNAVGTNSDFNGTKIINGTYNLNFQVGVNATNDVIAVNLTAVNSTATGLAINAATVATQANAVTASGLLDTAIASNNTHRARLVHCCPVSSTAAK